MSETREQRFERVFDDTYARVLAYAVRRVGFEDAQDVAAETFTAAWRRLESVPEDDPIPWLLATARNTLSSVQRSGRRRLALTERLRTTSSGDRTAVDPAEDVAGMDALRRGLNTLEEKDREVLILLAWDQLDARQAAAVLDISVGTFQVRVHRARKRLAAVIGSQWDEAPIAGGG